MVVIICRVDILGVEEEMSPEGDSVLFGVSIICHVDFFFFFFLSFVALAFGALKRGRWLKEVAR